MLHIAEAVADEHDARVDEEADEDAGSDDLRVGILVLVQVPCPAHAQKFTSVSRAIQDQDDEVENLQANRSVGEIMNLEYARAYRLPPREFTILEREKTRRGI
jgi:hypothetical protein